MRYSDVSAEAVGIVLAAVLAMSCGEKTGTLTIDLLCASGNEACLKLQDCHYSTQCPSGSECLPIQDAGSRTSLTSANCPHSNCACQIPPVYGDGNRNVLTAGFSVGSFELLPTTATEAAKAAYQWRPIYNARVIHCALFGCTPVVASYDGQPSRIVNFEQCALARRLFQPAEGVFDLGDPSLAVGNEIQAGGVLITTLLVGCWAYDESSLVRATALTPLVPKQTFNYRKALSMNCQDGSDGISCYDESGFGTCFQGHCRQRCLHDPDCSAGSTPPADVANDAGLEPPEGGVMPDLTSLSCRMLDTSQHVGVCIKEPHEGG